MQCESSDVTFALANAADERKKSRVGAHYVKTHKKGFSFVLTLVPLRLLDVIVEK